MSFADLDKYHALIEKWDDVINCSVQTNAWIKNMLNKIAILQADINFVINVSPEEVQYITSYINVLNTYIQTQPTLQPQ